MKKIVIGVTGASGSVFADVLIKLLLELGHEVHLVYTSNGAKVSCYELESNINDILDTYRERSHERLILYENDDLFSTIASGSYKIDCMVIVPCSMGTLAKIANGISDSLVVRAADVSIKEKRQLVLVTRESPLSSIHLENMLKLSRLGVVIMPPVPAFYNKPKTLQESVLLSVGRIMETIGIDNSYHKVWKNKR